MCWMNVNGQLLLNIFLRTVGTLQEDNAPCHVSVRTTQWKRDNHIPTLPWPPQSPDLNIIENVWRTLKIQLKTRVNDIKTKQDLKDAVQDIWYKLPLHYIQSLFQSIPTRLRAIMRGKGQLTKYSLRFPCRPTTFFLLEPWDVTRALHKENSGFASPTL